MSRRPLVAIPCCTRMLGDHPFHVVGDKYIRAVSEGADCQPLLIPALGEWWEWDPLLDRVDGLLVTGSPSNVEPWRYQGPPSAPGTLHDPERDATNLPLMRRALERGIPMLGICRGFQELNVVMGGTLHQSVQTVPGLADHRADYGQPVEVQYGKAHSVTLAEDGLLRQINGGAGQIEVNSVHMQGIDTLGRGLAVEARAPDGLVEAVRVEDHPFAVAIQWHPEWRFWEDPFSTALFARFGEAVRQAVSG